MTAKRRNLFLYLTIACFLGLISVFIVDGYLGAYDTIYITAGEHQEKIEPDVWARQEQFWSPGVNHGEQILFRYEVDNRRFSDYTADIKVSVWRGQSEISNLISQPISVATFEKEQLEWSIDTTELLPGDIPPEQGYDFSVIIERGEIERRIIVSVNPLAYPLKPVPAR